MLSNYIDDEKTTALVGLAICKCEIFDPDLKRILKKNNRKSKILRKNYKHNS
jgi:hypothetical protein